MIPSWYPNRENNLAGIFIKKHIQTAIQDMTDVIDRCVMCLVGCEIVDDV
jgi:hypothetical protein